MKLEDAYLRELMARLDGGALSDGAATAVADSPSDRRGIDRAEAEAALEQRLTSLRQQIAAINGSPSTPSVPPAEVSKTTPRGDVQPQETGNTDRAAEFAPIAPNTIEETGLESEEVEAFLLKYLLNRGASAGRTIAEQLGLPFSLMEKVLYTMKAGQLVVQKGSAPLSDYVYQLTSVGLEDARRHYKSSSYFGSLPVTLEDYIASVKAQSIRRLQPTNKELEVVFKDLLVDDELRSRIGQAVHAGKGFFLYGSPGNGKTSVAERVARAFGQYIWIPRAIGIAGEIIRMFDPCNHDIAPPEEQQSATAGPIDRRWVRIRRPTVIAGGELTMDRLEIMVNKGTGINEAPLQLKSNCGVLVIDDFGRQRMSVAELLNRWIVPLDRRYDFLNLPSGKTIQVPFDQLLIFSTNLEPRDLVDEAFLRRISYKIEVPDPTLEDFRRLMRMYADRAGFGYEEPVIEYLISEHYLRSKRPFRACHARDLLDHVRSFCGYHGRPLKMTHEAFDAAVKNYFGLMGGPTK